MARIGIVWEETHGGASFCAMRYGRACPCTLSPIDGGLPVLMNGITDKEVPAPVIRGPGINPPGLLSDLRELVPGGVRTDVPLDRVSRWRVGGPASLLVRPDSADQVQRLMAYVSHHQLPYVVLGSTSNLLFADEGLHVLVIQIGNALSGFRVEGNRVWCQAGAWVPGFARRVAMAGLRGAEHTCGIPGTLGGLICMNGGSQRKGIGDHVIDVLSVTEAGEWRVRSRQECAFSYRDSVFRSLREIIVSARFRFRGARPGQSSRREMLDILGQRRRKFPRRLPNCGSVFVSDPSMYEDYGPPGAVIEKCGLKGAKIGDAMVSPAHANFIVNLGHARAEDILALIGQVRTTVRHCIGYDMAAEVCYVRPDGRIVPAHLAADEYLACPQAHGSGDRRAVDRRLPVTGSWT